MTRWPVVGRVVGRIVDGISNGASTAPPPPGTKAPCPTRVPGVLGHSYSLHGTLGPSDADPRPLLSMGAPRHPGGVPSRGVVAVPSTPVPRRRLLAAIASVPVVGAAAVAATRLGAHAAMMRPGARGDSATRCGQCGAGDHTMLARGCPAAPEII